MNGLLLAGLLALVGAGLIAGFMAVGGPGYARMERNDAERTRDLRKLTDFYMCALQQINPEAGGTATDRCLGYEQIPDVKDPVTQEPYRYTRLGDNAFKVCATFQTSSEEREPTRYDFLTFEGHEGCVLYGSDAAATAGGATLEWLKD